MGSRASGRNQSKPGARRTSPAGFLHPDKNKQTVSHIRIVSAVLPDRAFCIRILPGNLLKIQIQPDPFRRHQPDLTDLLPAQKHPGRRLRRPGRTAPGRIPQPQTGTGCPDIMIHLSYACSSSVSSSPSICAGLSAAFTFPKARTITPFSSIRYVVRTTPIVFLPYIFFSFHTS